MKASELKIGNLVKVTKGEGYNSIGDVIDVRSINRYGINEWQDMGASGSNSFDGIEGVPLTEAWLVKFGFEKRDDGIFSFAFYKSDFRMVNLIDANGTTWDVFLNDIDDRDTYINNLSFVHQLQNLYFAIENIELTFVAETD